MLRTKELTKSNDLRFDDSGEGLSVSRGGGKGKRGNSKGSDMSKYRCLKGHKTSHFKRDRVLGQSRMITPYKLQLP